MNLRPNRWKRLTLISLAIAMTGALAAPAAIGQTADDLRARAQELEAQLHEAEERELALGEQINVASVHLAEAQEAIEEAQQKIAVAQAEADRLKEMVQVRAASAYKQAGGGEAFADLDVSNANDFEARTKYSSAAASQDEKLVRQLTLAQEELEIQKAESERVRSEAEAERANLQAAQDEAEAHRAEIARLESQVRGELADLVARERAAREAAAQREFQARVEATPDAGPASSAPSAPSGPVPGANAGASGAVAFALSKVGGPYCWGGTGPSCYDCSGLTQAAWAHGGLSIPRTSGAQFSAYPQIPLSAIQPGDLLFRDQGGSGHVAMATGGGMMVHATSSRNNPNAIRHEGISGINYAVRPG